MGRLADVVYLVYPSSGSAASIYGLGLLLSIVSVTESLVNWSVICIIFDKQGTQIRNV